MTDVRFKTNYSKANNRMELQTGKTLRSGNPNRVWLLDGYKRRSAPYLGDDSSNSGGAQLHFLHISQPSASFPFLDISTTEVSGRRIYSECQVKSGEMWIVTGREQNRCSKFGKKPVNYLWMCYQLRWMNWRVRLSLWTPWWHMGEWGYSCIPAALDEGEFPGSWPAILPPTNKLSLATEHGAELVPELVRTLWKSENSLFPVGNRNMISVQRICANWFPLFFVSFLRFLCFSSILHALILSLVHPFFLRFFFLPVIPLPVQPTLYSLHPSVLSFSRPENGSCTQVNNQTNPRSRILDKPIVLHSRRFPHFTAPECSLSRTQQPTVGILRHSSSLQPPKWFI